MIKKRNCITSLKSLAAFFAVLFCINAAVFSQDFYWENPVSITKNEARFPYALSYKDQSYVFFQNVDFSKKQITISCRKYKNLYEYTDFPSFAGPFPYSGDEVPYIYTACVNDKGVIAVSTLSSADEISVYVSSDEAESWTCTSIKTKGLMVAPRIFSCGGIFRIFISTGQEESFSIYTSESANGENWSSFEQFKPAAKLKNPFLPYLSQNGNVQTVVFQAQYVNPQNGRLSYQLYMTTQNPSSKVWSDAVLITGADSLTLRDTNEFFAYQNQRPFLYTFKNETFLAWERTARNSAEIWCAKLNSKGLEPFSAQAITSASNASRAILFEYKEKLYMCWFDMRRGRESVYMAKKDGSYWSEDSLCENQKSNQFVYPLFVHDDLTKDSVLTFIWQETSAKNKSTIDFLSPDRSIASPTLAPLSFRRGKKSSDKTFEVRITLPDDSSEIAGYSYDLSKKEPKEPVHQIQRLPKETKIKLSVTDVNGAKDLKTGSYDGTYYLSVCAQDYAGNWSKPAVISYELDTTPPLPPEFNFDTDSLGFMKSNTLRLFWNASPSPDISYYLYRFDYVGALPNNLSSSKRHPLKLSKEVVAKNLSNLQKRYERELQKERRMTAGTKAYKTQTNRFVNKENGIYVLSVCGVDDVGNVGEASKALVFLNKFEPETVITYVEQKRTDFAETEIAISGKGFTYDGTVKKIIIDRDGKAPYDLELSVDNSSFRVVSDKLISKLVIGDADTDLAEGNYRIGILHSDRGLYFSEPILKISQNGTLKIEGEYIKPSFFAPFKDVKYRIAIYFVIAAILIIFTVTIFICFAGKSASIFYETINSRSFARDLLYNTYGGKIRMKILTGFFNLKPSLRKKLVGFAFALIIIVVLGVSLVDGKQTIALQERTLAQALENRTEVLLESLCTGVKNFFPANNLLELTSLPRQKDAMEEAVFVTIIGQPQNSTSAENLNYVWATNDPDILSKIDTKELVYGKSRLIEDGVEIVLEKYAALDKKLSEEQRELSERIEETSREAELLYQSGDEDDFAHAESVSEMVMTLRNTLDANLLDVSNKAADSYPHFDASDLDYQNTDYLFFRPVMYRRGNSGNYVHGLVLVKISTKILVDAVQAQTKRILIFGTIITAIALTFGIFGASLFAMIIVHPVRRLEKHVEMIARTKNKLNLKGKTIKIKSNDEIGRLGKAVDNMTKELVAVAEEESLTMDGKAVQNAFLPLTSDDFNNKKSTAQFKDNQIECFGYYEGESGVSGDYFDYRRLDTEWFVAIKCDASGHGIPAAIIMTVVATIFRRYFDHWTFKRDGCKINLVVNQINDFIEKLGLKGKFATLIICLINLKTGELYTCNAGDRIIHIFEAATKKIRTITLSSAPTAGVFSNDLLEMRGGFAVEKHKLNRGDVLFLYTDGIEESTRRIRNADFVPERAEINGKIDDLKEEFGSERIIEIIEAVLNGKTYELKKEKNPRGDEKLIFDFERCSRKIEDSVIALASIEKVFRMYKTDASEVTEYIKVDKKIDEFLKNYFNRYEYYAAHQEVPAEQSNYIDYNLVSEDEQSDDLTLLAIKRL